MSKLSVKNLQAVCDQKGISYPKQQKNQSADQYKEVLNNLINSKSEVSKPGKSFPGES